MNIRNNSTLMILISVIIIFCLVACSSQHIDEDRLEIVKFNSNILNKEMSLNAYLPKEYVIGGKYPVLYFLPDYGGSDYTVINEYAIGIKADELVTDGKIKPLIIVGVRMDRSFGLNTSTTVERFETSSGKSFDKGMYEDYFVEEVVRLVDDKYNTISSAQGRYIGGYSMGGYAALHIAFNHSDMFSRVGGHSPSLFADAFPDKTVSDWLYPNIEIRKDRDPIYIAQNSDLSGLMVYLDTGETDVNVEGCNLLNRILNDKGVYCEYNLFPGIHSRVYCSENMEKYLIFYGAK